MSNQEILIKAIEKAAANGWDFQPYPYKYFPDYLSGHNLAVHIAPTVNDLRLYATIYNHDFAKAIWPDAEGKTIHESEETIEDERGTVHRKDTWEEDYPAWQYHLQQMVIAEDPIEYLGNNI